MSNLSGKNLKLAIQKEGRLTEETIELLRHSGFEFDNYQRRLFSLCRNFPLEIIFVRDDDIPNYIAAGTADLGIIGQNLLYEEKVKVKKLLNLRFGLCSLVVAVPKDSTLETLSDLEGKTIATTYPNSTEKFFRQNRISIKVFKISGSVEIAPTLGIAHAIADLSATGSSLALNDLKIIAKVYDSEAVLIANPLSFLKDKKELIQKVIGRFKGVLSAKNYKFVSMSVPKNIFPRLKKIVPGLRFLASFPTQFPDRVSAQAAINEDLLWESIEKLKKIGAKEMVVLPVEKIIV